MGFALDSLVFSDFSLQLEIGALKFSSVELVAVYINLSFSDSEMIGS